MMAEMVSSHPYTARSPGSKPVAFPILSTSHVLNNTATLEVEVPSAGPGTAGDGGGNGGGGGGGGGGGVRRNNSAKSQEERQARTAC